MSGKTDDAADLRGPKENEIAVFASSTTSAAVDLQSASHFGDVDYQAKFVRIETDQPIYYKWSDSSGATVDETATSGATRCMPAAAGSRIEEKAAGRYFVFKLPSGGTPGLVRVAIVQSTLAGTPRQP